MSRRVIALSAVLFIALVFPSRPVAQSKPTLKPADYDQFKWLGRQPAAADCRRTASGSPQRHESWR
jgi:hypothetical protein